jgi:hypothetical protein
MLITRLVIRLLGAGNQLLGWTEIDAEARGDGRLWATAPVAVLVEEAGLTAEISAHWVDVNVEARSPVAPVQVQVGQPVTVIAAGPVFNVGPAAGGLPAVTVRRNVVITPLTGGLGLMASPMGR